MKNQIHPCESEIVSTKYSAISPWILLCRFIFEFSSQSHTDENKREPFSYYLDNKILTPILVSLGIERKGTCKRSDCPQNLIEVRNYSTFCWTMGNWQDDGC